MVMLAVTAGVAVLVACGGPGRPANNLPPDTTQVTVLSRPSDSGPLPNPQTMPTDQPVASSSASSADDGGSGAPPLTDVTPAQLKTQDPGTYTVSAYVVRVAICPLCQPGHQCKPCAPNAVWVSGQAPAGGGEPADIVDLQTPDPNPYAKPGSRFRFIVTVTPSSNGTVLRNLVSATAM
jgi:hypothetical protein